MFEIYATSEYSLKRLCGVMYEEGLRTRDDNGLVKSRMAALLSEPFYYGKIRWNGNVYDGKQEPLIDKELFDRVQEILKGKYTPKYRKLMFTFKALIRCGECGRSIIADTKKGFNYYYCTRFATNCSQKKYTRGEVIEDQLLELLAKFEIKSPAVSAWVSKALKESHKDEIYYNETAIKELNRSHEQTQKRLDRLYDDKLDGKISESFYEQKFKQYAQEKEAAVEAVRKHSQADTKYLQLGMNLYELSQRGREVY